MRLGFIMVSCHHFNILLFYLLLVYCQLSQTAVFLKREEASDVLQRNKRANSFFEEFKPGSLERECLEEKCSKEEAREIFKNDARTMEFWKHYTDPNQCDSNPCQNGGTCSDEYQTYNCICPKDYEGKNCETGPEQRLKCIYSNGNCEQYCIDNPNSVRQCFCAEGYRLESDGTSCIPEVDYPCGRISILDKKEPTREGRIVGGYTCPRGECPWQMLVNCQIVVVHDRYMACKDERYSSTTSGKPHCRSLFANQALMIDGEKIICGGVLLAPSWIVTAAHCVSKVQPATLRIKLGVYRVDREDEGGQERRVADIIIHEHYQAKKVDNDIALLRLTAPVNFTDFVIPICLPQQRFSAAVLSHIEFGTVSGWGRLLQDGASSAVLMQVRLPRIYRKECMIHTKFNITGNMFCAGYIDGTKDSCEGDSGGPHVTEYHNTWFLTGIVSWGKGCAALGTYGVYTNVVKYINWLNNHMDS